MILRDGTLIAGVFNVLIYFWPVHILACSQLGFDNSKMSSVKIFQNTLTVWFGYVHTISLEDQSVVNTELVPIGPELTKFLW